MNIGIIGGTGKEGQALALRWAKAGHSVFIGSRELERGVSTAASLSEVHKISLKGGDNHEAVKSADFILLCIPFSAHKDTLLGLREDLKGKTLLDITVPLRPPQVTMVYLPESLSAALQARVLLPETNVLSGLHHVSHAHLEELEHPLDTDVLICGDNKEAKALAMNLMGDLGARGIDAGVLQNSIALEALTPVLIYINKTHKVLGSGLRITGLPDRKE